MRFKLTLEVIEKQKPLLPLNYQYELSSWIYKVIDQGDPLFSGVAAFQRIHQRKQAIQTF